ncbi:hypothetical protein D2V17_17565 [Aurantiacibacter xanthus]|uniref:Uncharacterized protein n=1 Tax=Aurantiacibacter xanthus TaxID=1784712 RepID=A0A3A1P177_9SPHN|nr:hypothetical protein [Aurantiacibacter xanthus]RIV81354.1 hypothetical protein D2V17_17565 [Aurantiacibacter xanthus]
MIAGVSKARWQTVIADLSLILFLVTASALDQSPAPVAAATRDPAETHEVATGETADIALTMWSPGPGAPPLAEWLAEQTPDESQRLAIVITYAKGGFDEALASAATLRAESGAAGSRARITIAEGERSGTMVSLVQDNPPAPAQP